MDQIFDHEKLDVYRLALEYVADSFRLAGDLSGLCTAAAVTVAKVLDPAAHVVVDFVYHRVGRLEALHRRGQLSNPVPEATLGFNAGFQPQIRPARAKSRAFAAEREAEKIQSFLGRWRDAYRLRLVGIDRQSETTFEGRFDPSTQAIRLASRQHDKIVCVSHQASARPMGRTVGAMEEYLEHQSGEPVPPLVRDFKS